MADLIRLNRTLAHIEANLALWNQQDWVTPTECGTAYCFAGWALQLEDIRICTEGCWDDLIDSPHVHEKNIPMQFLRPMIERGSAHKRTHNPDDHLYLVPVVARQVLGLRPLEGMGVFCSSNDLRTLRNLIDGLQREEPTP